MNEQEIRTLIRQELSNILKLDRYVFDKHVQILDARHIQLGKTNGTKIGTESTQKIGFLGATPIARQAAIPSPSGAGNAGVDQEARNAIDSIRAALTNFGLTA